MVSPYILPASHIEQSKPLIQPLTAASSSQAATLPTAPEQSMKTAQPQPGYWLHFAGIEQSKEGIYYEPDGTLKAHVWAPDAKAVSVVTLRPMDEHEAQMIAIASQSSALDLPQEADRYNRRRIIKEQSLKPNGQGYFDAPQLNFPEGALYMFKIQPKDGGPVILANDYRSTRLPEDVFGPSQVGPSPQAANANAYPWTDRLYLPEWAGKRPGLHTWDGTIDLHNILIYETHIGTFTPEGTLAAATQKLEYLKDLGINTVQLMPIQEFPGQFGWSYDTTHLFTLEGAYGKPEDLKAFVNEAHRLGLAVILDIQHTHIGPYSEQYTPMDKGIEGSNSPYGDNFNFNNPHVVNLVKDALTYWVKEFHMDGFRTDTAHDQPAEFRKVTNAHLEALEKELGKPLLRFPEDYYGSMDAVRPTSEGGLGSHITYGFPWKYMLLYSLLEPYGLQNTFDLKAWPHLVMESASGYRADKTRYTQDHDTVANDFQGQRITTIIPKTLAQSLSVLPVLLPGAAMVFMGQEMGAETPFKFFADLQGIPLARKYFKSPEDRRKLTSAPFAESKLNWDAVNKDYLHQFKHALTLRKSLPALSHGIVQNVYSKWGCLVYELEPPPGKGNPVKILMNPWPAPREVKEGQDGSVPNPLANSPEWTVRFRTAEPVTPDRIPSGGLMVYEKTAK